jgi:hypothetical protein
LERMSQIYEVVIYTASLSLYADPLMDIIDPEKKAKYRLFREHCTFHNNAFVKDLSNLGRDLKNVIIVDNSPNSYVFQPENAIPIQTWIDDMADEQLYQLIPLLELLSKAKDVRVAIKRVIKGDQIDYEESANELKRCGVLCNEAEKNEANNKCVAPPVMINSWTGCGQPSTHSQSQPHTQPQGKMRSLAYGGGIYFEDNSENEGAEPVEIQNKRGLYKGIPLTPQVPRKKILFPENSQSKGSKPTTASHNNGEKKTVVCIDSLTNLFAATAVSPNVVSGKKAITTPKSSGAGHVLRKSIGGRAEIMGKKEKTELVSEPINNGGQTAKAGEDKGTPEKVADAVGYQRRKAGTPTPKEGSKISEKIAMKPSNNIAP